MINKSSLFGIAILCFCVGCANKKEYNQFPFNNTNGFGNHFFGSKPADFTGIQFFKNAKTKGVKVYGVTQRKRRDLVS